MTTAQITAMRDAMRCQYLEQRAWITTATTYPNKRPETWVHSQSERLAKIEAVGRMLNVIADNAESFSVWFAANARAVA